MGEGKYFIAQSGDFRAYEIGDEIKQITEDQSFVAREIKRGSMTKEQALIDPRRNVLLQCIGASKTVGPAFYEGEVKEPKGFILCSGGFNPMIVFILVDVGVGAYDNYQSGASAGEYVSDAVVDITITTGEAAATTAIAAGCQQLIMIGQVKENHCEII